MNHLTILWNFKGAEIAKYDGKEFKKPSDPRLTIKEDGIADGDGSLYIDNVTLADIGQYMCRVVYSPDQDYKLIDITVYARPTIKSLEKRNRTDGREETVCSVAGFYPNKIDITLLINGMVADDSVLRPLQISSDGTYSINRTMTLQPNEKPNSLSCEVQHESLPDLLKKEVSLYEAVPSVQLFSSRRREDQEQVFLCDVRGFYPEAVTVNWLLNRRKTEIPSKNADGSFNKESYYRVQSSPDNQVTNISCEVQHETLMDPVIKTSRLPEEDEDEVGTSTSRVMAAILGSFIVTVAVSLAVFYKKIYKERFFDSEFVSSSSIN
ncbi:tyrosine-protein phosphatase non-receptor type substrate 1-like [Pelobates fuscus]|uniref:tyrosine-protein phosphatase non-receptor type substrate 1-like n=1 Tax=Pelobates fuscus TaxID=191477 RepID=UPI002FE4B048